MNLDTGTLSFIHPKRKRQTKLSRGCKSAQDNEVMNSERYKSLPLHFVQTLSGPFPVEEDSKGAIKRLLSPFAPQQGQQTAGGDSPVFAIIVALTPVRLTPLIRLMTCVYLLGSVEPI